MLLQNIRIATQNTFELKTLISTGFYIGNKFKKAGTGIYFLVSLWTNLHFVSIVKVKNENINKYNAYGVITHC